MINSAEISQSITQRYVFDISRHYKIRFSINPNTCLGLEENKAQIVALIRKAGEKPGTN